ncbi:hypothetical protein RIF29_19446 [Crotalaria pallida]|uniref:Uncharacterized protein n=1 Tax=Crotalaria pallida TaxID=3830 RepID=A0AAN9F1Z5_CROPI
MNLWISPQKFLDSFRTSVGCGFVIPTRYFRLECDVTINFLHSIVDSYIGCSIACMMLEGYQTAKAALETEKPHAPYMFSVCVSSLFLGLPVFHRNQPSLPPPNASSTRIRPTHQAASTNEQPRACTLYSTRSVQICFFSCPDLVR